MRIAKANLERMRVKPAPRLASALPSSTPSARRQVLAPLEGADRHHFARKRRLGTSTTATQAGCTRCMPLRRQSAGRAPRQIRPLLERVGSNRSASLLRPCRRRQSITSATIARRRHLCCLRLQIHFPCRRRLLERGRARTMTLLSWRWSRHSCRRQTAR